MVGGRVVRRVIVGFAALALVAGTTQLAAAGDHHGGGGGDHHKGPDHIFYIMMENHQFGQIIGNTADAPYINKLASHNGLATDYYGVTHPSLPNYLAAISGDFQGIWDDCLAGATVFCAPEEFVPGSGDGTDGNYLTQAQITSASNTAHMFSGQNLVDQLESHGLTWKAYMQTMPSVGFQGEYAPTINTPAGPVTIKLYAQKHDPFMYFSDINYQNSPRLNNVVPFEGNFANDLASGDVPNFVWISPDQCNDMHGISPSQAALIGNPTCGYPDSGLDHGAIQLGDAFLKNTVHEITHSSVWRNTNSSIVIVWDENDYADFNGCCGSPVGNNGVVLGGSQVPLIVVNSREDDSTTTSVAANHYSLLATIEHLWNLGCLANTCDIPRSGQLTRLFRN
jgi:phosphatidylinositol-3-phosphatase